MLFSHYVLFFFLCGFLGWVMEVLTFLVRERRFINRGFLIGPYCPVYGVGCVLMAWLLPPLAESIPGTFALAMLLCGLLEYLTSWAMEKLFHARWWDYSGHRFHLNGRICLENLLAFGILGVLVVKLLSPVAFSLFARIPAGVTTGLVVGLSAVFLADVIVSFNVLGKIRRTAATLHGDSSEALTRAVREHLLAQGRLLRRALRAFPEARLYNRRLLDRLRATRRELVQKARERNARLRQELEALDRRIRPRK